MSSRDLRSRYRLSSALILLAGVSACSGGSSSQSLPGGVAPNATSQTAGSSTGITSGVRGLAASQAAPQATFESTVGADSPLAFYTFAGTGTSLSDSSPDHLNGTLGSGVSLSSAPLVGSGGTASFAGGSWSAANVATVPPSALLEPATGVTVEAWVMESVSNVGQHYASIVSYGPESQGQGYVLHVTPQNSVQFWLRTKTGGAFATTGSAIVPGKLYQIVGTYDGQHAAVYVNGVAVPVATHDGSAISYDQNPRPGLAIGGALDSGWPTFHGKIGAVAIYAGAMSAARVQAHYAAGNVADTATPAPTPSPTAPPVAQASSYQSMLLNDGATAVYPLTDQSSVMTDVSTNKNSGTYTSGVTHPSANLTSATSTAAAFTGTTDLGKTPKIPAIEPASALSVEMWIKEAAINSGFRTILCEGCNGYEPAYMMQVTPQNSLHFWVHAANGAHYATTATSLVPGQTYHVVGTYDGSTVSIYVNGLLVNSAPASGVIQGYNANTGLALGSAPGSSSGFAGTVNELAIFNRALPANTVESHYASGVFAPMMTERPAAAKTFSDSVGVDSVYADGSNWPTEENLLVASGIRHIRLGIAQNRTVAANLNDLASKGVKGNFLTALNMSMSSVVAGLAQTPNMVETIEGPNEPNLDLTNWVPPTLAYVQSLHSTVRGTPALASVPIVAPALSGGQAQLGDISADVDYGNMHDYFASYQPETTGYGSISSQGVYGSLSWNMNVAKIETVSKPIISTETGWGSTTTGSTTGNDLPFAVAAKYLDRVYLEHFNAGVARTFAFNFVDLDIAGNGFTNYGMVQGNMTPKPSYYALKSMLSTLSDSSTGTITPLTYRLSGNIANLNHTLLQKADGSYYLALWLGVPGWDSANHVVINNAAQNVTVTTQNGIKAASLTTIDGSGTAHTSSISTSGASVSIPVTDSVAFLKLSV